MWRLVTRERFPDYLSRKTMVRAVQHQTSRSPPRLWRHSTSQDESGASHNLKHLLEHRRAAEPQAIEPTNLISGPYGSNLGQVKNKILEQLRREIKGKGVESSRRFESPYSGKIMAPPLPKTFKMSNLIVYEGKGDLSDHIDIFKS